MRVSSDRKLSKQRPYLLRAMHEWMTDNDLTPHIVVDAGKPGLSIPSEHVQDGKLVLNLSYAATRDLLIDNEAVSFEARFGGVARRLSIPIDAIIGIYARETGQGMIFSESDVAAADADDQQQEATEHSTPSDAGRPTLKIVK